MVLYCSDRSTTVLSSSTVLLVKFRERNRKPTRMGLKLLVGLLALKLGSSKYELSNKTFIKCSKVDGARVCSIGAGSGDAWDAQAEYTTDTAHPSHFGELSVKTNAALSDDDQMYAAGFIEGQLTASRIFEASINTRCQLSCDGNIPDNLRQFVAANEEWLLSNVASNPTDSRWMMMGSIYQQYQGLIAGYRASDFGKANPLNDDLSFWVINSLGDMFEILPSLDASLRPDYENMSLDKVREELVKRGHCSALVKISDDLSEVYAGHSSWFIYSSMLRIYKHYSFPLSNPGMAAVDVSFSSYPGTLSSLDDFYLMSSGLAMLQTTNGVVTTSLYDQIKPQALLAWYRVRAANMLAHSGLEWGEVIDFHNSGTGQSLVSLEFAVSSNLVR